MKEKIGSIIKASPVLYSLYYFIFSAMLFLLKCFVRTDPRLILFNSFGGKRFDDSSRAIFEEMKSDMRFQQFRFVWAFHRPECFEIQGAEKVQTDSLLYYVLALKARCWVTNSAIERGLNFIGKNTFYFNCWHGTPMKKMGRDIAVENCSFRPRGKCQWDAICIQGTYDAEVFQSAFGIVAEKCLPYGLPRNDVLVSVSEHSRQEIRTRLHIQANKKVILYAPTFREFYRDTDCNSILQCPLHISRWKEVLGDTHVVLFRAHYETAKVLHLQADGCFLVDCSNYPDLNDLMIASDMLLSDYSSIFFDYAILEKPMLCYAYDLHLYTKERGFYIDLHSELPEGVFTEEEKLLEKIRRIDFEASAQKTRQFREKYIAFYGSATKHAVNRIAEEIFK